jgi:menaquinone-dependent protoporphyrinogen IX oxidase
MLGERRMRTLVVFYSRSGTTRLVAEKIARGLGADTEELVDPTDRRGVRGYLRSGFDARLGRWMPLEPVERDPMKYDLVVVGTPVWVSCISAPVRTFLGNNARRLRKVAFFVTEGGRGEKEVFRQMAEVVGVEPAATVALKKRDVEHGRSASVIASFVASLRGENARAAMHA